MGVVGLGDQYVVGGGVFVGFGFDFFGGVVWDCLYCGGVCGWCWGWLFCFCC